MPTSPWILRAGARSAAIGLFDLTATEYELLLLFMQNPRRVLPRHYIMEKVWGYDFEGESNVLEVYVGYLRQKLEENEGSALFLLCAALVTYYARLSSCHCVSA